MKEASYFEGLFAGQFDPEEYEPLIEKGELRKSYEGAAGFMGLAKLRTTGALNGPKLPESTD